MRLNKIKYFEMFYFQDLMVGDEASQLRTMLDVTYPMENGIVRYKRRLFCCILDKIVFTNRLYFCRNWDDMCHVWDYTFGPKKMNIDPKECKIMLTEPPMNPIRNREKMIEVNYFIGKYINAF